MLRLFFSLFILLVVFSVQTRAEDFTRVAKSYKIRVCGMQIPDMLKLLCRRDDGRKRSTEYDQPSIDYEYNEIPDLDGYPGYPFRTRMESFALLDSRFRNNRGQKRGIVHECCRKQCHPDEFLSYCP